MLVVMDTAVQREDPLAARPRLADRFLIHHAWSALRHSDEPVSRQGFSRLAQACIEQRRALIRPACFALGQRQRQGASAEVEPEPVPGRAGQGRATVRWIDRRACCCIVAREKRSSNCDRWPAGTGGARAIALAKHRPCCFRWPYPWACIGALQSAAVCAGLEAGLGQADARAGATRARVAAALQAIGRASSDCGRPGGRPPRPKWRSTGGGLVLYQ